MLAPINISNRKRRGRRLTLLSPRLTFASAGRSFFLCVGGQDLSTQTSQCTGRSGPPQRDDRGPSHFFRRPAHRACSPAGRWAPEKIVTPIAAPRSPRRARRSLDPARSAPAANFVFRKQGDEDDYDVHRLWIALRSRFGGAGERAQALVLRLSTQARHSDSCDNAHS
jgi:hypothetical protein